MAFGLQTAWNGGPSLASDGNNNVVYASIGSSNVNGDDHKWVVASLSFDGGQHFSTTQVVNADLSNGCADGQQADPSATFDMTVSPPQLVIAWRHAGAALWGACIKAGGTIDTVNHTINWNSNISRSVGNMVTQIGFGIGGIIVQAGNGAATIVYSDTDHVFNCPDTTGKGITWYAVTTNNNGANWQHSHSIEHTEAFHWCLVSQKIQNTKRAFGFIQDAGGTYYAVVNSSPSAVVLFQSSDQGTTWRLPKGFGVSQAASVFFPTLASDGPGRVGLTVYASDPTDAQVRPFFFGNVAARNNAAVWQGPASLGTAFFDPDSGGGIPTELGDFTGMATLKAS